MFTHTHAHTHTHTHSHSIIYVVETSEVPDTSTIPDTAYIAIAASAADRISSSSFTEVMGDGRRGTFTVTVPGGSDVMYDNRAVRAGRNYFFFVRLFSSVVSGSGMCLYTLYMEQFASQQLVETAALPVFV